MSTFLPQHDPDPEDRQEELTERRRQYQYCYQHISPLAMIENVPIKEQPSLTWLLMFMDRALDLLGNLIEVEKDNKALAQYRKRHLQFKKLASLGTPNVKKLLEYLQDCIEKTIPSSRPQSFDYYADIFRKIELPAIHKDYTQDASFARMRIAGSNPVVIARIPTLDDRFPVTEDIYRSVVDGDTLDAAGKEGRLYLADYRILSFIENGSVPFPQKYIYAPLALFAVDKTTRQLRPVAIQARQEPGKDNPIFTPHDGPGWLIAKTIVETADGNYHEAVSHLGRTHLFVEPFVVATHRNLAPNHPLNLLLVPHFEGTLAINNAAQSVLVAPGRGVDQLMGGTIDSDRLAAVKGLRGFPFNEAMPPKLFAARGVDDPALLPEYPYRDDALAYWGAIRDWVASYLRIYYRTDAEMRADAELGEWIRDLGAHDGGRVPGIDRSITEFSYLVDTVALILYTSSVQHAAVNFPQADLMSYCPNMPLALYAPAPTRKEGLTEQDYFDMLPPKSAAITQQAIMTLLGSVHYTTLGEYPRRHFRDRRVAAPLEAFQARLRTVGDTIKLANRGRQQPYTTLLPAAIPQSINI